jgi:hypothetical protein
MVKDPYNTLYSHDKESYVEYHRKLEKLKKRRKVKTVRYQDDYELNTVPLNT